MGETRVAELKRDQDVLQTVVSGLVDKMEAMTSQFKEMHEDTERRWEVLQLQLTTMGKEAQKARDSDAYKGNTVVWAGETTQRPTTDVRTTTGDRGNPVPRLEFPDFDGTNLEDWIYMSERYFEIEQTAELKKVRIASIYMYGKAFQWHFAFIRNRGRSDMLMWTEYVEALTKRFGKIVCDDPMGRVKNLKHERVKADEEMDEMEEGEIREADEQAMPVENDFTEKENDGDDAVKRVDWSGVENETNGFEGFSDKSKTISQDRRETVADEVGIVSDKVSPRMDEIKEMENAFSTEDGDNKEVAKGGDIGEVEGRLNDDCGITPHIFEYPFTRIRLYEGSRKKENLLYRCQCSCLEIYNEQITDLNLKVTPQVVVLVDDSKDVEELLGLTPEKVLLKLMNFHLMRAGCVKKVTNLSSDLKDGEAYAYLFNVLAPEHCTPATLDTKDAKERAKLVLVHAEKLDCKRYLTPYDIVEGFANLHLAFVAQILNPRNGMSTDSKTIYIRKKLEEDVCSICCDRGVLVLWDHWGGPKDIHSIGSLVPYLKNLQVNIRAKAADVVSTIVQNNSRSQQWVRDSNDLEYLLSNFTSDPDVKARTQALGVISFLIRHNKPSIVALRLANGYATMKDALSSENVRFQRKALNLIQYLLHGNNGDCDVVSELGFPRIMMQLANCEDSVVREATLRSLLELARYKVDGTSGRLADDDEKLKQLLEERIRNISSMTLDDLEAAKEEWQLVDSICDNQIDPVVFYDKTFKHQAVKLAENGATGNAPESSAKKHIPIGYCLSPEQFLRGPKDWDMTMKRSYAQFHLEFGQSGFLMRTCSEGGMKYPPRNEGNEKAHLEFLKNYTHSIRFKGWRNERIVIVHSDGCGRMVSVQESDPHAQRNKVEDIVKMMEIDLGCGWIYLKLCKVYLFVSTRRIVGCLVAEPIKEAFRIVSSTEKEKNNGSIGKEKKPMVEHFPLQFGKIVLRRELVKKDPPVNQHLLQREARVQLLRFHMDRAQHMIKQVADKHRSDQKFGIRDWVYKKPQPYRQPSAAQLRRSVKDQARAPIHLPGFGQWEEKKPVAILQQMMVKRGNRAAMKVLILWSDATEEEATWEFLYDLLQRYPTCTLEDKCNQERVDLMQGNEGRHNAESAGMQESSDR